MCLVQNIEVVSDWFTTLMRGAVKMIDLPIGGPSEFARPAESVDQELCYAGTIYCKFVLNILLV